MFRAILGSREDASVAQGLHIAIAPLLRITFRRTDEPVLTRSHPVRNVWLSRRVAARPRVQPPHHRQPRRRPPVRRFSRSPWGQRGLRHAGTPQALRIRRSPPGHSPMHWTRQNITTSCTDWQSDNTFVLTINNEGLLTAHNSGSATVTTTCQGVFARGLVPLSVMPTTLWTRSGMGAAPFVEVPLYVGRLRITGQSNGRDITHFAALADGFLLFGQNLQRNVPYAGTHVVRPRYPSPWYPSRSLSSVCK